MNRKLVVREVYHGDDTEIKCEPEKNIIISKVRKQRALSEIIGNWQAPIDYELSEFGNPTGREVW